MEWGKAKTILIIAFIVLNITLYVQLRTHNEQLSIRNVTMSEFSEDVKTLMKSRNIQLKANMPIVTDQMKQLTVTYLQNGEQKLAKAMKPPISLQSGLNSQKFKQELERKITGLKMSDYQYDQQLSSTNELVYHQLYEGVPMFEVNMRIETNNNRAVTIRRDIVTIEAGEQQDIISSYTAVSNLIENYLIDGAVIESVQLGFHGQRFESSKQFLTPFWRVILADGQSYYVHALNGAVEAQ